MSEPQRRFTLNLLGPFRLSAPDGTRIEILSRKGMALFAMLAVAKDGERTRAFLRDKLWGRRDQQQAYASMRRELSNLRNAVNRAQKPLLICERDRVRLDFDLLSVDVRRLVAGTLDESAAASVGDFLEGLDVSGAPEFDDWLRDERAFLEEQLARARASTTALPASILDVSQPAPGFGGRPALAVLPFQNLTGQTENDYLCEGFGEELIDRLSRLRWLPIIARSSSFSSNLQAKDPRDIGRQLGAKYILDGRLRREGSHSRLSINATDAETGTSLWSQRFRLPDPDSPETLDQLVSALVALLESHIDRAEQGHARAKPQSSLNVDDLIWRGRWHLNRITREDAQAARELLSRALALDPNSSEALVQLTFCIGWSLWADRRPEAEIREMRRLAQRAILADSYDGRAYMLAGIAELWLRQHERARSLLTQALTLNPSLALAHAQLGSCEKLSGHPSAAITPLRTALRLSPNDTDLFYVLGELGAVYCMLGEWPRAIEHADAALSRRSSYWYAHVVKINALARGGDMSRAKLAWDALLRLKPGFTPEYIEWLPFADRSWNVYFAEGVAAADEMRPIIET